VTTTSWWILAAVTALSVLDWIAVATHRRPLEYAAKPAATVAFVALAASLDVTHDGSWAWLIVALVLCLAGDVFLMLPHDAFVPGLGSFALAQIAFSVGFLAGEPDAAGAAVGAAVAIPVALWLTRRFVGAMVRSSRRDLVVPVCVYVVVISTMAVCAVAAGSPMAIAGAAFFLLSDSLIAESRFVRSRPWHRTGIMVTYHLALAGLVLGAL
jgi:uncharacterized membrane protein YhhN